MKTSELLDQITVAMLDDRASLVEGQNDQLFATGTVLRHLNEGQRMLARDAGVIEDDSSPEVIEIELTEDVQEYPLHKSILIVKAARLSDTSIDLVNVGYNDARVLPSAFADAPDYWDVNLVYTDTAGRPSRFSTDMGIRVLRLNRPVDATTALLKVYLRVVRLPLTDLDESATSTPEVPEEWHLELCKYAAGACLVYTADIDAELRTLGRGWVKDFKEMVRDATRDKQRQQQPKPRFRFGGWAGDSKY